MKRVVSALPCLLLFACSPSATTSPATSASAAGDAGSPTEASGPKMPAAGEYVALSEARYGQLDAAPDAPAQGEQAPDFELANHLGGTTRLSDVVAEGPVVLMFYRGFW